MAHQLKTSEKSWNLKMTQFAVKTDNPLRKMWENYKVCPNPRKETITLQIGESCEYLCSVVKLGLKY